MTTRKTIVRRKSQSRGKSAPRLEPNIFERIEALGRSIPDEEQARAPRHGARNLHHYLYGVSKQDPD